jgi:hypothetical protein
MFIFAIQNGAIHRWISSSTNKTLELFLNHLNKITKNNKRRNISIYKYILLIQELSKYSNFQKITSGFKIDRLESVDPRFIQAITGSILHWIDFKNIFEKLGLAFEVESNESEASDGLLIQKKENNFLLRIFSENKLIFEGLLSESELQNKILDYYNEIMRYKRKFEIENDITPLEWRVVSIIRKVKRLRYRKSIKLKSEN